MANGEKKERGEKEMKEILYRLIAVVTLIPLILTGLLMAAPPPTAVAQEEGPGSSFGCPPDWDKSSLSFTGSCSGDCKEITTQICNTGDGDMAGTVAYEVWYKSTGNPKDGSQVGGGTVPALKAGECATLTYAPTQPGNYKFKAYQRPGHPGTGELWSETCSITCPPPTCVEVDTHYGEWECGAWGECVNGEQSHQCSQQVWTTDKNDPSIECSRTTEYKTETQECNLCQEVDTHYGEWSEYGPWGECINGEHSRTRTREVWTTDVNHPEHECSRTTEPDTQTEPCNFCVEVDTYYGEWSEYGPWGECINGEHSRTRTREVWTTDKYHPEHECSRTTEPDTQTEPCLPEVCEVVDTHGTSSCGGWSECVDGTQWRECIHETWTTDYYRPEIVCGRTSSVVLEEQSCEVPEDKTPAGQVELIFGCPVLESYDPVNWDFTNNVPTGKSLFDIPGPSGPDQTKIHPRGGYWRYAESVNTMFANGRLDPYGEYWALLTCWSVDKGWWPVGLVRSLFQEEDVYPTYPILWWVEDWANPGKTPNSFDEVWYQVIRPQDFGLVGLN